jgi:hypothetical protein
VDRVAGQDTTLGFLPIGGSKRESQGRRPVRPVCPLASWPKQKKASGCGRVGKVRVWSPSPAGDST